MKLVLEARHLFDGSLHAVAKHATDAADSDPAHRDQTHLSQSHIAPASTPPASVAYPDVPALTPNPSAHEILFVDPRVANWQSLASSVNSDVQVVLIDPTKDGIDQVTAALQGRTGLTSIQFLTYGQPGELELGSSAVTTASLSSQAAEVASWGDHLAAGADIEFWGCDVGQGSTGQAFVDTVHTLTGANVGAATNLIGAASLGGDWVLNDTTGPLHGAVFSEAAMADYQGVLDTANPVVTLTGGNGTLTSGTTGDVLLGDTFTETLTFTNTATGGVGYGPIVNLYVPTHTATDTETATLGSATYLGNSVTTHEITLTSTAAGHVGTVGAYNPYVLDSTGAATFIAAPSGFVAGDSLYVLVLPFGSFTPGEPSADITLHFTADSTSELTSHSNNSIAIAATGAFEFGASPLNDPADFPPIVGATVSSATTVSLLNVTATTNLHEGETATGPDNPFDYVVTVIPAPVVTTDAISGLTVTFQLPGQVEHTGGSGAITVSTTGTPTFTPATGGALQGGSVSVALPSLSSTATITIPVFVPQTDASGSTILTAANHYQQTIDDTPAFSYTGTWTPLTGLAASVAETVSGGGTSDVSFTAKGLAIQVTDSTGGSAAGNGVITQGQTGVTETINFQVSDYLNLNNLVITDVLGDGATLHTASAPVLAVSYANGSNVSISGSFGLPTAPTTDTVNGQTVALSGAGKDSTGTSDWSYSRNDVAGDGTTTITFMVGALLADSLTSSVATGLGTVLQGGSGSGSGSKTQGTVSFEIDVLDKYTETNPADTSSAVSLSNPGQSLREDDSITNTVTDSGTSADIVATSAPTTVIGTTYDDSGLTDTIQPNTLTLTVVDVDGLASDGSSGIKAGDTVTYRMTYTLAASANYGNLSLSSFLPLPVFSTTDPLATGGTGSFTAGTGLVAGTYNLVSAPSGASISGVSANGTANSLSFALGTHDDASNTAGQTIVIDFSVKASNAPFANGLYLTNLANSQNFDAHDISTAITANAIQQVELLQPELVTKTGVASLVANDGTTAKGTYAIDPNDTADDFTWTTQSTDPSTAFAKALTSGNPLLTNPLGSSDLNVTGAVGSDTARIVTTVENTGNATAYNVEIKGATLPTGATVSDVTVYNSAGTAISTSDLNDVSGATLANAAARVSAYFGGGIQIADPSGLAKSDTYYIVYDLALPATQTSGATLTTTGTLVDWWNNSASTSSSTGFVSGTAAIGVDADALTDNATIGVDTPSLAKTVVTSNENDDGDVPLGSSNHVVQGDVVTYQLTVTVPEGTTSNNGGDVTITDVLPAGTTYVGLISVSTGGASSSLGTSFTDSYNASTNTVTFDLGVLTNSQHDTTGTVTIQYQVQVSSTLTPPSTGNTTFENTATLTYNSTQTVQASATATEVDPNVAETVSVVDNATGDPVTNTYSGETLDYTVKLQNNGGAPANDLVYYVEVPTADLSGITSLVAPGGGTITDTNTQVGGNEILKITASTLATGSGNADSFTFQATVKPDLAAGTQIIVGTPTGSALVQSGESANGTYNSLPSDSGHVYSGSDTNTVSVATFTPNLGIIGERNDTSGGGTGIYPTAVSSVDATIGDIVRYSAYVEVPEGENTSSLVVTLPTGMTFDDTAGSVTVLLVSPGADLTSNHVDSSAQEGYSGTFSPTSGSAAQATTVLDTGYIGVSGSTITFDLGTLRDNEGSASPDYVIVQFNAIVANASGIGTGSGQTSSLAATVSTGGNTSSAATVTVEEPNLTLTKSVTSIVTSGGVTTVTYSETVDNTGNATAYNVALADPEGSNVATIGNANVSGTGGLTITAGDGTTELQAGGTLLAGKSNTFTYTEVVTNAALGVSDTTASVTYTSLSDAATGGETLAGTSTGASASATGSRDGSSGTTGLNHYEAEVTLGLGVVDGNVWNDIGSPLNAAHETASTAADTELSGITISGSWTGGTSSVVTDSSGNYALLLPDASGLNQKIAAPQSSGSETLVYDTTNGSTFNHLESGLSSANAALTVTPSAGTAVTGYNFAYRLPDAAPTLTSWGNTSPTGTVPVYAIGGAAIVLGTGAAGVADSELDTLVTNSLGDYSGTVLTVARNGGANANDSFGGGGTPSTGLYLNGGTVDYNGNPIGTYTLSSGTLQVTFGSGTSAASVEEVLNHLTYSNTGSANQLTSDILIDATLSDHNTETGTTAGNAFQGTGGVQTSAAVQVLVDLAPTADTVTFTKPNDTAASGAEVAVNSAIVVSSADSFTSATVTIGTNDQPGEDVLVATAPGVFTQSFDATTGTLTLTASGATAAQLQAALRSVDFYDSSATPTTTPVRTVTFTTTGTGGETNSGTLATVTVVPTDDSPILTPNASLSLTQGATQSSGPVGAVGTLVSSLVGGITDPDFTDEHNLSGAASGTLGIAIDGANTTDGTWYYSTDNGATWTAFASAGMTAISDSNALHLLADANTRIYFQATATNANGVIDDALTFHAWDQYYNSGTGSATANGTLSALPTDSSFGQGTVGSPNLDTNASAYSSAVQSLPLTITAPTGAVFTKPNDTAASGAAIVVDAAAVLSGSDAFSSATVTITNVQAEDQLTFTPNANTGDIALGSFSGGVLTLTSSGGATAAEFQAALRAVEYYDSSATPITTTRAVALSAHDSSTDTDVTLVSTTITVVPTDDSPILTPNASLTLTQSATQSVGGPVGAVGTLVSSLVGGIADPDFTNEHDLSGAASGTSGIAIDGANTTDGTWYYSTNNGATWTAFASAGTTAISDSNALHLLADANTRIYFQATAANANGTIDDALTFRAWDQYYNSGTGSVSANGTLSALPTDSSFGQGTVGSPNLDTNASAYSSAVQSLPLTITSPTGAVFTKPNDTAASGAEVAVNSALVVSNADTFTSATVTIGTNDQPGEDVLVATAPGVFTQSFDAATGTLTLTASGATAAQLQAALQSVDFYDSSTTPTTTPVRTITIAAHDATTAMTETLSTTTMTVVPTDDSPILTPNASLTLASSATENGAAPVGAVGTLVSSLVGGIADPDFTNDHNLSGAASGTLGIAIDGANTTDGTWYYSTNNGATWTAFASAGTTAISDSNALHLLADANTRIYFQATATNANGVIDDALTFRAWDQYYNSGTGSVSANGTLSALPTDSSFGQGTSSSPNLDTNASAYSSAVQSLPLTIASVGGTTFTKPNDTAASGAEVAVNSAIVVSSTDSFTSATVTIGTNDQPGEDVLVATAPGVFTQSFDAATGTLTLTASGATAAQLQAALRSVDFYDSSATPTTTPVRTITIAAHDATTATTETLSTTTMTVVPTDDSPILTPNASLTLASSATENGAAPVGAVGTLVSSLVGGIADPDFTNDHNLSGAASGTLGIAIDGANTTEGTWYYSTDNGATWTTFASAGTTAISDSNALHLLADANTRIYFQATATNANGVIDDALTFRAWDQYYNSGTGSVSANGTLSALPTDSSFGQGTSSSPNLDTNASAYSSAVQSLPLTIASVGGTTFTKPNDTAASGAEVAVNSAIVVSSTDTFTSATVTIGTNDQPGEDVLVATAPGVFTQSFDAATGTLTLTASGATAAQLQAALQSVDFYDSSATPTTTPVRTITIAAHDATTAMTETLSTTTMTVVPTDDSPILHGTPVTLPGAIGNATAPVGAVGTLVSTLTGNGNVTDADGANAHDGATPGLVGIAIVGADTTEGTWFYSTNNGATWTEFAGSGLTAISGTNALHLVADANTRIYFEANSGANGTVANALTFRAWDQYYNPSTGGATANGTLSALPTDSSFGQGTSSSPNLDTNASAYSSATQSLPLTVIAATGNPILPPQTVGPTIGGTSSLDGALTTTEKPPTDDLGPPAAANHGGVTDDFLQQPIIPQVSLIGSVGNKFVLAEQEAVIAIPSNLFEDTYQGAQLEFDARNPAGGALPSWLDFDPRNLTFSGTPPASAHGAVDVLIVARDQFGNEATATFRILVGRESEDLQHLLEPNTPPPSTDGQAALPDPNTHVAGNPSKTSGGTAASKHADTGGRHDARRNADLGHAQGGHDGVVNGLFASLAQPASGIRHEHSAFSAQLRQAGPIGRLTQARHLLETLAKTVSSKPAA